MDAHPEQPRGQGRACAARRRRDGAAAPRSAHLEQPRGQGRGCAARRRQPAGGRPREGGGEKRQGRQEARPQKEDRTRVHPRPATQVGTPRYGGRVKTGKRAREEGRAGESCKGAGRSEGGRRGGAGAAAARRAITRGRAGRPPRVRWGRRGSAVAPWGSGGRGRLREGGRRRRPCAGWAGPRAALEAAEIVGRTPFGELRLRRAPDRRSRRGRRGAAGLAMRGETGRGGRRRACPAPRPRGAMKCPPRPAPAEPLPWRPAGGPGVGAGRGGGQVRGFHPSRPPPLEDRATPWATPRPPSAQRRLKPPTVLQGL